MKISKLVILSAAMFLTTVFSLQALAKAGELSNPTQTEVDAWDGCKRNIELLPNVNRLSTYERQLSFKNCLKESNFADLRDLPLEETFKLWQGCKGELDLQPNVGSMRGTDRKKFLGDCLDRVVKSGSLGGKKDVIRSAEIETPDAVAAD